MAKFRGAELVCCICGEKFKVPPSRAHKATTCSHKCSVVYRAQGLMRPQESFTCKACGLTVLTHKSHASVRVYCSKKCMDGHSAFREKISERTRGENNAMWKGGVTERLDGYLYEICYGHPLAHNGKVLQHRLIVERHLLKTNPSSACLVQMGDNWYLDPKLVVHHKNFDRKDNRIENLQIMTKADHQGLHNRLRAGKTTTNPSKEVYYE